MKVVTTFESLKRQPGPVFLAAGFFDGLHLGHRKVIDRTIASARAAGGRAWVLTFDTHPLRVLNPAEAPLLLTSGRHKMLLLRRLDLDGCLVLPFTHRLANLDAREFVSLLHRCIPPLAEIFAGRNWRFGRYGRGSPAMLARLSRGTGLTVNVIQPVTREGETVSSTRVRAAIVGGNLEEAAVLLGRPFGILGTVTRGRTVGRRLGFPTANLRPHNEVLPPYGVYAVHARLGRRVHEGVLNHGVRPTYGQGGRAAPTLELHVMDLNRDLYGTDIEVLFVERLRDERRFGSETALRRQIAADVLRARSLLAEKKLKESLYSLCGPHYIDAQQKTTRKEG